MIDFPPTKTLLKKTRQSKFKNVVGALVKKARLDRRVPVSQEDLSGRLARAGVRTSQTGISKLEARERYVMDYEVLAISRVLRVPLSWLYGIKE